MGMKHPPVLVFPLAMTSVVFSLHNHVALLNFVLVVLMSKWLDLATVAEYSDMLFGWI